MILALRTDKPEAELVLFSAAGTEQIDSVTWQAHRELSDTLLLKIDELLEKNHCSKLDLSGIVIYQGPGSFTGLRIGISVANALAYSLQVPIAAAEGEDWLKAALKESIQTAGSKIISPIYGAEANITRPRK